MIDTFSILYNSTHYFVFGEKKIIFFPKFLLVCDCDFTEFFFNCLCMDKILEKLYFLKKDICNLYIILSSYTTAADPLK